MACLEVQIRKLERIQSHPYHLCHAFSCFIVLLNAVERGELTADAPGIPWKQTEHINIIHLVLPQTPQENFEFLSTDEETDAPSS